MCNTYLNVSNNVMDRHIHFLRWITAHENTALSCLLSYLHLKERKYQGPGESDKDLMRGFIICWPRSLEYYSTEGYKELCRANLHACQALREAIVSVSELQHVL